MEKTMSFRIKLIPFFILALIIFAGINGCKEKQKVTEEQKEELPDEVQQAKERLQALIANEQGLSIQERRDELEEIKQEGYTNSEVLKLIGKLEQQLAQAEKAKEEKQASREMEKKKQNMSSTLSDLFNGIANAPNRLSAESKIDKALEHFESGDVTVLRIVYQDGNTVDYDEPTTIKEYLNYLKDQKKNPNTIENIKFNSNGKVTELELEKK